MIIVNTLILIFAIIHWVNGDFNKTLFLWGFAGSVFDTIGKVVSLVALEYGPGGVSIALTSLSGPALVIIVALTDQTMVKTTELIALILCVIGS